MDLKKLLIQKLEENGNEVSKYSLLAAPEFGGEFKNDALNIKGNGYSADVGQYSTKTGDNIFGYLGAQPWDIDGLKLGGALGAYGPSSMEKAHILAGLLASKNIKNGEARLMLSPGYDGNGARVFMGYHKSF